MIENTSPHLNATRLAGKLGKTAGYVSAMRAAGYQFVYGATTTEEHARAWIKETKFTPTTYFKTSRATAGTAEMLAKRAAKAQAKADRLTRLAAEAASAAA